ncbi:methyltransferase, ATP-grasp peptide maturase system [Amycolatopsis marina]|uniref:Protein-L-isoaspartate O-methyltransferase n=1 Tax=Amycolatopsis marina TaxID=490629 RepID=A0A1I0XJK5_9PSEU|nr:ATP-grasp peptide maturase system methyltransferase [Amycolatopsis marina]SFB00123.1 methyltransferase, ATP-grasp peptide maturase system [Amycolatopsis marina]
MPLVSRNRRLVATLRADRALQDPQWIAAFAEVPRHVFLPRYFMQIGYRWVAVEQGDAGWLERIYADTVLVTQLDDDPGSWSRARRAGPVHGTPTSSSSMPGIMAIMLEELRVRDGDRVLEIGTGTGYNTALLCHRLGDTNVSTVDIDSTLVPKARAALAECDYHPSCLLGDGELGYAERAPHDRVLATCAVSRIPPAWLEQTRPGGLIVTTLNRPIGAGLVRITAGKGATGTGRVLARDGRFMPLRAHRLAPIPELPDETMTEPGRRATLSVADALTPPSRFEFFAGLELPEVSSLHGDSPEITWLAHSDGSWARQVDTGDGFLVWQGGPQRLWDRVEEAHARWLELGQPERSDFGITIDGEMQEFWLGSPESELRWPW